MNATNLYLLYQGMDFEELPEYEKNLSNYNEVRKFKADEIKTLKHFLSDIISISNEPRMLDGFFWGFIIPHISKEFDLLKIYDNGPIINIELKSQQIEETRIIKQLKQNRHYLSHMGKEVLSFCYVLNGDDALIYEYDENNLSKCGIEKIICVLNNSDSFISNNLESYFRAKDFLISPINTPEKFIAGQYYLTEHQESIKKDIIEGINQNGNTLWGIRGKAGTGKTLLLYDIAKTISDNKKVCVIHSGILSDGHKKIDQEIDNLDVIAVKNNNSNLLDNYDCIFVDESQRLYQADFDIIINKHNEKGIPCVFAHDFNQTLSVTEQNRNISSQLEQNTSYIEKSLTNKIRTNPEIVCFVTNMANLAKRPNKFIDYSRIEILYARDVRFAYKIINFYQREKNYKFIAYTPSSKISSDLDRFSAYTNTHYIIGQEFDNVMIVMDNFFKYSEDGRLQCKIHPNPDYILTQLWFQAISRAREKICIIVLDNKELFLKLLSVKNNPLKIEMES